MRIINQWILVISANLFIIIVGFCVLFELFIGFSRTTYAPGYREKLFNEIKTGMTQEKVTKILGKPLEIIECSNGRTVRIIEYKGGQVIERFPDLKQGSNEPITYAYWTYSKQTNPRRDYYYRYIKMSPDGVVIDVKKGYYAD